jgi:nitrogen regulatory protein PII
MNKVTTLVKTSEVMPVRRALFDAGSQRIVVTPLHNREWDTALSDWYGSKELRWQDAPVRLDIWVEKYRTDAIVSAFMRTATVGKIEKISNMMSKRDNQHYLLPALKAA